MVFKTARLTLDLSLLPQKSDQLGILFERHSVAKIKASLPPRDMVLVKPAASLLGAEEPVGPEPRWNSILCGMLIKGPGGTSAQGTGQFIITGQRFIGMIDDGVADGGPPLSVAASGSIFCFTCNRDDVNPVQVKKRRLMPSDFSFHSKEEQPAAFHLLVFAAAAYVANGKTGYWHNKDTLRVLSEEGRLALLKGVP